MQSLPEIVEHSIKVFREDSELLLNMAGVYPGDVTGDLCREAFLLEVMADVLESVDWDKELGGYEADLPKVEVTCGTAE